MNSVLHYAAHDVDMIRYLVQNGAEINLKTNVSVKMVFTELLGWIYPACIICFKEKARVC